MKRIFSFIAALMCAAVFVHAETIVGNITNKTLPDGWVYITNNEKYPDPGWYSDGGLKLNFEGQGVLSPTFSQSATVEVTLTINALNQNTKQAAASEDVLTVTGLDAGGETVATSTLKSVEKGDANKATLNGTGIVQVKVIMTGYPHDGTKYCNINLGGVTLETNGTNTAVENTQASPQIRVINGTLLIETDEEVTVYDTLGHELYKAKGDKLVTVEGLQAYKFLIVRVGGTTTKVAL